MLSSHSYDHNWKRGETYVTTEFNPLFDAADMARCGKDVFVQRSHVSNDMGIEWIRRHLGDGYSVHKVEFDDYRAIHIDASFVPLRPGLLLVDPDRPIKEVPDAIKNSGWELVPAPRSTSAAGEPRSPTSRPPAAGGGSRAKWRTSAKESSATPRLRPGRSSSQSQS